jgi:hypothetical protein
MMAPENRGRAVTRIITLLGILAVLALVSLTPSRPSDASHEGTEHCYNDFNASEFIDISDVSQITGHFGEAVTPATAHLDIDRNRIQEPGGNGYIDISDLSLVTADFGSQCVVDVSELDSFGGPTETAIGNCESISYTWLFSQGSGYPYVIQHSRSATKCTVSPSSGNWTGSCVYTFFYRDHPTQPWQLYGNTPNGNFQFTQLGNFLCGKPCPPACAPNDADLDSFDSFLPCGKEWVAKAEYWVYFGGQFVHHNLVWVGQILTPRIINCT